MLNKEQEVGAIFNFIKRKYNIEYEITNDLGNIKFVKVKGKRTAQTDLLLSNLSLALASRFGVRVLKDPRRN